MHYRLVNFFISIPEVLYYFYYACQLLSKLWYSWASGHYNMAYNINDPNGKPCILSASPHMTFIMSVCTVYYCKAFLYIFDVMHSGLKTSEFVSNLSANCKDVTVARPYHVTHHHHHHHHNHRESKFLGGVPCSVRQRHLRRLQPASQHLLHGGMVPIG